MKPLEIKGARTRLGYTQQYMADRLGISLDTYRKKEKSDLDSCRITIDGDGVARNCICTAGCAAMIATGLTYLFFVRFFFALSVCFYRREADP